VKLSSGNVMGRDSIEDPDTDGVFKILTVVLKKPHVFWCNISRRLFTKVSEELGTSIVRVCAPWKSHGLKMEAASSFERSATIH
jgi:hypothetical protein